MVRNVLIAALRTLPSDDDQKKTRLAGLFEVSDEDLRNKIEDIFHRLSNDDERRIVIAHLNDL